MVLSYQEWVQEQRRMVKSPSRGGTQTPISPAFGALGTAPPGYAPRPNQGNAIGVPAPLGSESKYKDERNVQPQSFIDDVDMASNWYSPFEPVYPFGPPYINRPREWDFPTGYNLNYIPQRMELMQMLRGMARTWGVLSTIVATRQDQLLRIPWTIQRRDKPKAHSVGVDLVKDFFKRPDGKLKYSQWCRKYTSDLLILDAPSFYFSRDRRGRPINVEVLDGATIFPLIDDAGRRPDSVVELDEDGLTYLRRQPAFQQIIKGFPMIDLDESELMYVPMRPRPDLPMFGYPPTEQILVEASEAVRKTFYQLDFWAEGTIPDLIVTVPDTWTPRQIAMFQAHFDALLSGNLKLKSKVRFLPGGMKPFDIKGASGESLWSQRDETLIRLCCYAYSVSPAPFVKMLNRSTAQNAQQMAEEEGLYPFMSFHKDDIMDVIIQEQLGYDDIEFTFLPKPEPDAEKQAKIHDMRVKDGVFSINEARNELGLEPIPGGDEHTIQIGNAIVPLKDAAQGKALPGAQFGGSAGESETGAESKPGEKPQGQPQGGKASPGSSGSPVSKATRAQLQAASDQATGHLDNLSHLQLHDGNYPKGHLWLDGLNISIENKPGSKRGEKDQHKTEWEVRMPSAYGYIRGTIGADGDQIDCYLGKDPESGVVWVIDQNKVSKKGKVKGFDEHKVMLAYKSLKQALSDYLKSHFNGHGHERLGDVVQLTLSEFKTWLKTGNLKEPIADQVGKDRLILKDGDLRKNDTVSQSTNLNWYDQTTPSPKKKRKKKVRQGPRWLELGCA